MAKKVTSVAVPRPAQALSALVEQLSPRRQEIIRPVIENPREHVLLSVRGLAESLATDPATIVRIVRGLGFANYKSFKQYLHDLSLANVTALDSMQTGIKKDSTIAEHNRGSLEQDVKNLASLRHSLDYARIEAVAKRLSGARNILLLGGDLAASLVTYLEYQLNMLGLSVLMAGTTGRTVHITRNLTKKDVVIAISFRRGLRQTVEGMQRAKENGAYCIGITDTYISPLAQFADEFFLTSVESPSFGASYVAPVALMNILLLACANAHRDRTMAKLRQADEEQRSGYRWYGS